ncbi:hypothetical protein FNF27_07227 [Cafeteria roenbergensis]|uniref:Uncharacterized protein n=1 Tax=Cafeteria roenbergensis TaxID=33653 RepID=A0A5A8D9D7_CAFRO|nr:hypothetical protein FNF31_03610 [Cafeteria roenbergensis]KAA0167980.1 hypothetical protein FNF27_07227 [Cafeteria roenbergensis]
MTLSAGVPILAGIDDRDSFATATVLPHASVAGVRASKLSIPGAAMPVAEPVCGLFALGQLPAPVAPPGALPIGPLAPIALRFEACLDAPPPGSAHPASAGLPLPTGLRLDIAQSRPHGGSAAF